jgi:hypothetical protein
LAAAGLIGVTATATYHITKRSLKNQNQVVAAVSRSSAVPATLTSPPSDTSSQVASKPVPSREQVAPRAPSPAPVTVTLANNSPAKLSPAQTYDQEISRLRRVVARRRGDLDSTTIAVLEKNLHIIDDAIAQCRQALEKDPSSAYLNESLTEALDNKVQLLRAAATLPAGL